MTRPTPDPGVPTRRKWIGLAAAATLAATLWAALLDDVPTEGATSPPRSANDSARKSVRLENSVAAPGSSPALGWPAPRDINDRSPWRPAPARGLAAWNGPPPPPPPPPARQAARTAARPQPQAPAFPYTLIGRLDDGEPQALLSGPMRSFGVKVNEVIDGQWRLDAVGPEGVTLTWLPGSEKKNLIFAAS